MNAEFKPLFKLGRAERIQLVEDLWDSIAMEELDAKPSEEKCEELRRRKARLAHDPASAMTWEQVKERARTSDD